MKNIKQRGFTPLLLLLLVGVAATTLALKLPDFTNLVTPEPQPTIIKTQNLPPPNSHVDVLQLQKYLTVEAVLLGISDNISLYFKDLVEGKEISINPVRSWIPASTIKSYVVLEAFRQRSLGLLNFDRLITIKAKNVVPTELETDTYPRLRDGTIASVNQLIEAMITQSDNSAYNTLLDILDRRNINSTLRQIGITETVVGEKLNLDDSQFQADLQVLGRQPNTTTAKDLATFFNLLYDKKVPDSEEMLAIFKKQRINNMIPALLPENTLVAHKTGDWAPIYHDGGVIYKPSAPFILAIFTNGNNPNTLANLARVAYYQNAQVVGEELPENKNVSSQSKHSKIYLAQNLKPENILGQTNEKFPSITLADLGVTTNDLVSNRKDIIRVNRAFILPNSILYIVKQYIEIQRLKNAKTSQDKIQVELDLVQNRLSEIKTLLQSGKFDEISPVLTESQGHLKEAATLAEIQKSDSDLLKVKQLSDLHYATFADALSYLRSSQKEEFIEAVYNFYQQNKSQVQPKIQKSIVADPFQQQPVIGTIKEIENNKLSLQFEDSSIKNVILSDITPVRDFRKTSIETKASLKTGNKIAIAGQQDESGNIIPVFILNKIPKELPEKKEGTVTEIDLEKRTIQIEDEKGQSSTIQVTGDTVVKSRDTGVSLEGIKAGSKVTTYGETTLTAQTSGSDGGATSQPQTVTINATSVTVTENSSGSNEKVEDKQPETKKEENKSEIKKPEDNKDAKK